jgi:hypothetical protein
VRRGHAFVRVAIAVLVTLHWAQGRDVCGEPLEPEPPRFALRLSLPEFSVLSNSAASAVGRYGGQVPFQVELSRSAAGEVVWSVTVEDPRLMRAWSRWVADKSLDLIKTLNADSLDAESRLALKTVQSLSAKLERSEASPIWDTLRIAGRWTDSAGGFSLVTESGVYGLTGLATSRLRDLQTRDVVVTGTMKVPNELDIANVSPRKLNTLEIFTMSGCPYGQAAVQQVVRALKDHKAPDAPRLDLRFIFYRTGDTSEAVYTSLHGPGEVQENLVQMLLRDRFPDRLADYLLARSEHPDTSWQALADRVGLSHDAVKQVTEALDSDARGLMEAEYAYVAGQCDIHDGSPTFFWESQRVKSLADVPALGKTLTPTENCSREH